MSSLKSHFRHSSQQPAQDLKTDALKHVSRIPTKPPGSGSDRSSKPVQTVQHVSRLARRASKSSAPSEHDAKSSTTRTGIPTAAVMQTATGSSRRSSITSPGNTQSFAPPIIRTPSLVSGSSVSTFESPRSTLRRKPSGAIDRYALQKRAATVPVAQVVHPRINRSVAERDIMESTVLGISLPFTMEYDEDASTAILIPDMDQYDCGTGLSRDFSPPIHGSYAPSATPSTRYTDSPFSHAPTPSSASSISPNILASTGSSSSSHPSGSPTRSRPPLSGRRSSKESAPRLGLPPVRESSTSSSNSTVRINSKVSVSAKTPQARASDVRQSLSPSDNEEALSPRATRPPVSALFKRPVRIPPELAHLVEDDTRKQYPPGKPQPPTRPTRDGTSNISDMSNPSAIVKSDLPRLYTAYHKRTSSQETPVSANSPSFKARFGFSSRSSSRTESSRNDSAISPPQAARKFHRSASPEATRQDAGKLQRKDSPAVGTPSNPGKPKVGFFTRKPKGEPPRVLEKPKRRASKGPAAGTGHEGYGRFGARSRNGSSSSSTGQRTPSIGSDSSEAPRPRATTSKKNSRNSKGPPELDDFLRDRIKPVILRGSGSTFSATASSSDLQGASIHPASSKSSSLESLPQSQLSSFVNDEAAPALPSSRFQEQRNLRKPSDSSEDDFPLRYASLATRRSSTRTSSSRSRSPVKRLAPIRTELSTRQVAVDNDEDDMSAWAETDSMFPRGVSADAGNQSVERGRLQSPVAERSPNKHRWNFLQRFTSSPRHQHKGKDRAVISQESPEYRAHPSPYRRLAHYAVHGSAEVIGLEEVELIAQENETSPEDSTVDVAQHSGVVPCELRHSERLPSTQSGSYSRAANAAVPLLAASITAPSEDSLESPELLRAHPAFAQRTAHIVDISRPTGEAELLGASAAGFVTPDLSATSEDTSERHATLHISPRQPRLSPIGRIPAVVSKRDRDRKLPDNSFSRPFARTQPRPIVKPPGAIYSQIREMASPIEYSSQPVSSTSTRSDGTSVGNKSTTFTHPPSTSTNRTSMDTHGAQSEFFSFPARKNSDQSYSSSSGPPSWMTVLCSQPQQQEDIWNEYNDLIDEVMPLKTPTTGSSLGAPFQYSSTLYEGNSLAMPTTLSPGLPPTAELPLPPSHAPVSTVLTVPQQISRFLQPSLSPLTPDTLAHFVSGYESRSTSTLFTGYRTSVQPPARSSITSAAESIVSSRNSQGSWHSRSASLPEGSQRQSQPSTLHSTRVRYDVPLQDITQTSVSPTRPGLSNLRVGALMTSKWLSFGRVLFSPAHHELQFADEPKILVIDGLSSDWSYYVALSYPSVQVHNLTPSTPASPSFAWSETTAKAPINHHQIPLVNIATPFPYPKGFFSAVLFRFPTATTESAYTSCISECKRVLRPGGYLEVSVLDLDLMNMGVKARTALRGLKTRMQARDQRVCLRNLSDILVRMIGRRGFEAVQRCIVGVPTAGRIPRSQDMSSASSDSGRPTWQREGCTSKSQEFNFADLLEDVKSNQFGDGSSNDEAITKMVAKVGRWWYSSCYEKALVPGDSSIWSDPGLLRECERQGTSFRLLICHAQKPTQTRRRTVSV